MAAMEDPAATAVSDSAEKRTFGSLYTYLFEPDGFAPLVHQSERESYGVVSDHLGTPLEMYDTTGERVGSLKLDIYGQVRDYSGRIGMPFRYPGQYHDWETGLYYNRFRYYDPGMGGYISQDPIGLAGGNPTLYGYVQDVNGEVDIFGLDLSRRANFRSAKRQAGIPASSQFDTHKYVYDGSSENRTVYTLLYMTFRCPLPRPLSKGEGRRL